MDFVQENNRENTARRQKHAMKSMLFLFKIFVWSKWNGTREKYSGLFCLVKPYQSHQPTPAVGPV